MSNRLVIRRQDITKPPVVVDEFTTVEFYDDEGSLKAFIQELGKNAYAFCSEHHPDWEEAKKSLGQTNGDIDLERKFQEFFSNEQLGIPYDAERHNPR